MCIQRDTRIGVSQRPTSLTKETPEREKEATDEMSQRLTPIKSQLTEHECSTSGKKRILNSSLS